VSHTPPFKLPRIASVSLNDFDLYRVNPDPSVTIDRPVLCLVGAKRPGQIHLPEHVELWCYRSHSGPPTATTNRRRNISKTRSRGDRIEQYFTGRVSELRRGSGRGDRGVGLAGSVADRHPRHFSAARSFAGWRFDAAATPRSLERSSEADLTGRFPAGGGRRLGRAPALTRFRLPLPFSCSRSTKGAT